MKVYVVCYLNTATVGFLNEDNAFDWIEKRGGKQIFGWEFTEGYTIREIEIGDMEDGR